jgi:alpha-tubulin suppressor-like RCC1 family protein
MDELPLSKKVVQIAVGLKHTLALTEDQEVYSWGKGPALGHYDIFDSNALP